MSRHTDPRDPRIRMRPDAPRIEARIAPEPPRDLDGILVVLASVLAVFAVLLAAS